jgi:hypothetical protein
LFVVELPRAKLPARLVAYDSEDRVVSASDPVQDFLAYAQPARGRAELLWRVGNDADTYAELLVGPSTHGDECEFIRRVVDGRPRGTGYRCMWRPWSQSPVQIHAHEMPLRYVGGRVRDDVRTVRVRFADGDTVDVRPRRGYVMYAIPSDRVTDARRPVGADGVDTSGRVVGSVEFPQVPGG